MTDKPQYTLSLVISYQGKFYGLFFHYIKNVETVAPPSLPIQQDGMAPSLQKQHQIHFTNGKS